MPYDTGLYAENISVKRNNRFLLNQLSVHFPKGKFIGLIGPNGAGKSTLLKSILGLNTIDQGKITWDGEELHEIYLKDRGKKIGYVAQGAVCHWPMTAEKIIELGRFPHQNLFRRKTSHDQEIIQSAFQLFDLSNLKNRLVPSLSGGERARVMLARAYVGEPDYLLADEPVADLDPGHQLQVMNVLQHLVQTGHTVITVLHDLNLAYRYCHELILLKEGRVMSSGPVDTVLTVENIRQAYGIEIMKGETNNLPFILPLHII